MTGKMQRKKFTKGDKVVLKRTYEARGGNLCADPRSNTNSNKKGY